MTYTVNRRQFIATLIASSLSSRLFARPARTSGTQQDLWVSAQGKNAQQFSLSAAGESHFEINIHSSFRGHGVAQHPGKPHHVLMFARRPGRFVIEADLRNGKITRQFSISEKHNLQGHGCFSNDGRYLYTTEAENHTGHGKIVVRDAVNYQVVNIFDSYGIGPHEIKLMPNSNILVVANGGILTRPETGRKKLNLSSMHSSLCYIDSQSGKKLQQVSVTESKASIRHLDIAKDGTVAMAMQLQRSAIKHKNTIALGAIHKPGNAIQLLDNPTVLIEKMHDYMGSVAVNNKSRIAGFTSPKGNLAAFWHLDSNEFIAYHQLVDVCGISISSDEKHFVLSNSLGEIRLLEATSLREDRALRQKFPDRNWDNHMIAISA